MTLLSRRSERWALPCLMFSILKSRPPCSNSRTRHGRWRICLNSSGKVSDKSGRLTAELIQHVWHSKRDLVGQVFSNTDIFRSGKSKLAAALDTSGRSSKNPNSSGLRYNVQPATPTEDSPTERSTLKSPRLDGHHELGSDDEDSPRRRGVRRFLKDKFQKKDPMGSHAGQSTESVRQQ
jgi:hypothetical protein